jgi:cell division protein FtsB
MEINKHKHNINIFLNYLISILILYFLYHIFAGNYGVISLINSNNILNGKIKIMNSIQKDIAFKKNKINKMKGNYIDADILDEEIRKNFGYAKDNEIVIFSKDLEKIF